MHTTFSKCLLFLFASGAVLLLVVPCIIADEARFFRIAGPTATTITAFTPDGYITWTNAQIGSNYTVQIARGLGAATNWVDYVQIPVSNYVTTTRIYDVEPPTNMALIPAGSFVMGNCMDPSEGWDVELPLHTVYVSAFYMDINLVTYSLWTNVYQWANNRGYSFWAPGAGKASNHPVQFLNWYDLVKWCNARSQKEGLTPAYYTDAGLTQVYMTNEVAPYVNWGTKGYRLPTEAEWEKAARGGASGRRFPWGNSINESQANYYCSHYSYESGNTGANPIFNDGILPYTNPVGYFAANGYGLYDMAGNVEEWCWDWYSDTYYGSSPGTDPRGPADGQARVLRGGGWFDMAFCVRCSYRNNIGPGSAASIKGFRCVR